MGGRIRDALGESIASTVAARLLQGVQVGPMFDFSWSADLFGARRGMGPLYIAWDTNVLIDYFDYGARIWQGDDYSDGVEDGDFLALEALDLILALAVVRDVRFVIFPAVIEDAKKRLSAERHRNRLRAFEEFSSALRLVGAALERTFGPPGRNGMLDLPDRVLRDVLESVPAEFDRTLVRATVDAGVHVFMTTDRGVLRAATAVKPLGVAIAHPQELLGQLFAAGAFDCLLDPRLLTWPLPDQQRIGHWIAALPRRQIPPNS